MRRYLYSRAENCTGSYDVELMCVDVLRTECHTNADYPQDCDLIDASCIQELVEAYPSAAACAAACTGGGGLIAFADQFNRVEDPIT